MAKKIAIIGYGYVGRGMEAFLRYRYPVPDPINPMNDPVLIYDPPLQHWWSGRPQQDDVNSCDIAFICVPTPSKPDGSCDTSIVEGVFEWLTVPLVVVKSTVVPGTCKKLQARLFRKFFTGERKHGEIEQDVVFSPEFMGVGSYYSPHRLQYSMIEQDHYIFGGLPEATQQVVELYQTIAGPNKRYTQTTWETAEMAKYMINSYFATKVAYCHEVAAICNKIGVDYNQVRELFIADPRVEASHTAVFGPRSVGEPAVGGKCLPKDLRALRRLGSDLNLPVLEGVEGWCSHE